MHFLFLFSYFACSPCKTLCSDMADLARDCGYEISVDMVFECRKQQSRKSISERGECRTVRPSLEEEWDCEELAVYFDASSDDSGE
jgi:hypothetical protein